MDFLKIEYISKKSTQFQWIELNRRIEEKKNTHTNIPAYLILREYTQMYISLDKK